MTSPCGECGYDFESLDHDQILDAIAALAGEHRDLLASVPAVRLRGHPRPRSWSPLEYGCHVRDVLRFQRERIMLAQAQDTPEFVSMRRDERAVEERYNEQDPLTVARQLTRAAGELAATLTVLDAQGWLRSGVYPWPVRAVRTVEWIGRRTVHELAHHLFDERRLINAGIPA
jgi:hypothetical protein